MITRRAFLGGAGAAAALALPVATPLARASASSKWDVLRSSLTGTLVLPSDSTYTTAKQLDLAQFDGINPQAIAYAANAADVATCIKFAQDNGIAVAPRSGGHSAAGYSTTTGLVIDVSHLNAVAVGSGTATVGAGTQLVDITSALGANGLAVPGGFCPTVALGGFLQGGGLGLLTRSHGVGSDNVSAVQIVLANGQIVTASPSCHPDLYWAVRGGGGGNFGIVTSYTVTPSSVPTLNFAELAFSYSDAVAVMTAWGQWLANAPSTIGGVTDVLLPDAAPGNTPQVLTILGSVGTSAEFTTQMNELISMTGATPLSQTSFTAPYQTVMMNLYGCGGYTVPQCHRVGYNSVGQLSRTAWGIERSRLFNAPLSESDWAQIIPVIEVDRGSAAGTMRQVQVLGLGGVANNPSRSATAYVHRDAIFNISCLSGVTTSTATSGQISAGQTFADTGFGIIDPLSSGESYQNFIDRELTDWRQSYYAENYPALVGVKTEYDPHDFFHFAQSIDVY